MILLLPNQLFRKELLPDEQVVLVEHPKFFTQMNFHRQKLVLHRASMKAYSEKNKCRYIELDESYDKIFEESDEIKMFDPVDHGIKREMERMAGNNGVELKILETPNFLASRKFNRDYFDENRIFQLDYYKKMRKRHDILVEEGKPQGGKWSFDSDNRKKLPEDMETPEIPGFSSEHVEEAIEWVEDNFPNNPGEMEDFFWPVTREQAVTMLEDFLENRMENFGDYQDAFEEDLEFGFHSLISSSMNIGLLNPEEVVEKTLEAHERNEYPMNSVEGFLRQIVGWREFIRAMYQIHSDMSDNNFFDADNSLPEEFYTGDTGLPPVDHAVRHVQENAYTHHIERLMVLGNVMLLLEIDPDDVYRWFMEMFIDSYEWVMVPNIYGMSQYSWDEMMTKPYISSSNYINKMSHCESGKWEDIWDGLYWNFINRHEKKISGIQRMSFMTSTLNRMDESQIEEHIGNAENYMKELGIKK